MAKKMSCGEIVKTAAKKTSKKAKVEFLKQHAKNPGVLMFFQIALHPAIKFLLPDGPVPYKKLDKSQDQEHRWYQEIPKLYRFVEGGKNPERRRMETLFILMMESLDPDDADIFEIVKDKKLPKGITKPVLEAVYPEESKFW